MARPLRIEFAGAVYHITSRGKARKAIFPDRSEWGGFLDILSYVLARSDQVCHASCLIENHHYLAKPSLEGLFPRERSPAAEERDEAVYRAYKIMGII